MHSAPPIYYIVLCKSPIVFCCCHVLSILSELQGTAVATQAAGIKRKSGDTPWLHQTSVCYVWCHARARSGERGCGVELPDAEVEVPVPHMPANTKFWSRSMSKACSRLVCFKKNLDVYRSRPPRSGSRDSFRVSPNTSRHKLTWEPETEFLTLCLSPMHADLSKSVSITRVYIFFSSQIP